MLKKLHRRTVLLGVSAIGAVGITRAHAAIRSPWRALWNGKDLHGWHTWVGVPHKSRTGLPVPQNAEGNYIQPLGEDQDPRGVYSVVQIDGQSALRISGELFGALTSQETFSNYHLYARWRWGTLKWEPRATGPRDSGILIHATGPHGTSGPSRNWMRSIECQIQEGDCGDLWSIGGVRIKASARSVVENGKRVLRYDRRAPLEAVPLANPDREPRVHRGVNAERANGAWNVTEIIARRDTAEFKINGQSVMVCTDARIEEQGALIPLTAGRIQLQSEGAEIFFSELKLRPL